MEILEAIKESKSLCDLSRKIFGKENYTNREKCKKILFENGIDWKEWIEEKKDKPKKYCLFCGKEIPNKGGKKFCSRSCSASYNNKGVARNGKKRKEKYCLECGRPLTGRQNKFCSSECELDFKYKERIRQWKDGSLSGCDCCGNVSSYVRKYLLESRNYACEVCGFNKINPFTDSSVLQIHHIDGDCTNNKEESLQVLCPNCHALTENFGNKGQKSGRIYKHKDKKRV